MGLHERFLHERAWSRGPGIQDGNDAERAVLGEAENRRKESSQAETLRKGPSDEYLPFSDAIQYAKEHQPKEARRSPIIRDLRRRIALLSSNIDDAVHFYTAVGTPLDTYHGVDAFFEQNGHIVTIDLSLQEKHRFKAHVLMTVAFDKDGRPAISPHEFERVAHEVAMRLNNQSMRKAA